MLIPVGNNAYVEENEIVSVVPAAMKGISTIVAKASMDERVIDYTDDKGIGSVIFLKGNKIVLATPKPEKLMTLKFEEALNSANDLMASLR